MKRILFLLTLTVKVLLLHAQPTPGIVFSARYGGSLDDKFWATIQLKNGNYICSGYSFSTDGQGAGNQGYSDFFIVCLTEQGQLLWKKVIGGSGEDGRGYIGDGQFLSATADGGFFFAGGSGSSDGDIGSNRGNRYDIFVARFDENGNILWKKTYGGDKNEFVSGIETTPDGGCVFSASTLSSNSGDVPPSKGVDKNEIWIVKLGASGSIEWSKLYGGSNHDVATSIKLTNDGGYIFTADVSSTDGDLAIVYPVGGHGKTDVWVVKLTSSGAISWTKRLGGALDDNDARVISSISGDYYVVVNTLSIEGDFPNAAGLYDLALVKLNGAGAVQFIKMYGGTSNEEGFGLVESSDGNIILTGVVSSTHINGFNIPQKRPTDVLLFKASKTNGEILWVTSFGGNEDDFGRAVNTSTKGDIIIVGETLSNDGDFPGRMGGNDAFITVLANYNAVTGLVFYDNNGNGTKESNEPAVQNIKVVTSKTDSYSVASFSESGTYYNEVDSGSFVTTPRLFNKDYYTVTPDSFLTNFPAYYGSVTRNIALKPIPGRRDLRSIIVAADPARAGFTSRYKLICYNAGTDTVPSGTITFIKEPRTSFLSSVPSQNLVSGDTISWLYKNFKALDTLRFDIALSLAQPPIIKNGDSLIYSSMIEPLTNDLNPTDNNFTLNHIVTGSFDPNDKYEAHGNNYTSVSLSNREFLSYTIRFQNTGTDTAFKVVVKDTLDRKLDISSLEILETSHRAKATISDNICTWSFPGINLPDSNKNKTASHGFITYRVRPSSSASYNDTIKNAAYIYFDYNLPIKTNTQLTVIRLPLLAKPTVSSMAAYYCDNQPQQKIKINNIPAPGYHAVASAKIDNASIVISPDSTIPIIPNQLGAGQHTLTVSYNSPSASSMTSNTFLIVTTVTPEVNLRANLTLVVNLVDPVILTAAKIRGGGGIAPTYVFAKDLNFSSFIQAESQQNIVSVQPSSLLVGDNKFYVKMKTNDTCYTQNFSIDSITVTRSAVTGIVDPLAPNSVINVSPNPFENELLIKGISPGSKLYFEVYDAIGRKIFHTVSTGQTSLEIQPKLASGFGFLVIYNMRKQMLATIKIVSK